jgi:hypothetical protein
MECQVVLSVQHDGDRPLCNSTEMRPPIIQGILGSMAKVVLPQFRSIVCNATRTPLRVLGCNLPLSPDNNHDGVKRSMCHFKLGAAPSCLRSSLLHASGAGFPGQPLPVTVLLLMYSLFCVTGV